MKNFIVSTVSLAFWISTAIAADLPSIKEPVADPTPPMTWAGFHVGINAGGTWADDPYLNEQTWNVYAKPDPGKYLSAALLSGATKTSGRSGFIGGGQIGYDWQLFFNHMSFVTGIEADFQGMANSSGNSSRTVVGALPETVPVGDATGIITSEQRFNLHPEYLGTVRGRIGYLASPTLQIYGTGGLAYGGICTSIRHSQFASISIPAIGFNSPVFLLAGSGNSSNAQVGWTLGGGLEWMVMTEWSVKAEYLYYDLGKISGSVVNTYFDVPTFGGASGIESVTNYSARITANIVRAGVNYHFNLGSAPVVAKF